MAHRWKVGVLSRLPAHYRKHRIELSKPQEPVHYIPEESHWTTKPETGEIVRKETVPIPGILVPKMHEGLWGGETVIKGYFKKKDRVRRVPHFWIPSLQKTIVYSEVLDKYLRVVVTDRTLRKIDECYGFDNYIFKTPVQDLKSQLALDLRRKMILTLIRPDGDPKKVELAEKYKPYLLPEDEAEWFGLSVAKACKKQLELENTINKPKPLKLQFRQELLEKLREWKLDEDLNKTQAPASWVSKWNPFQSKDKSS